MFVSVPSQGWRRLRKVVANLFLHESAVYEDPKGCSSVGVADAFMLMRVGLLTHRILSSWGGAMLVVSLAWFAGVFTVISL
jgi:hypothetical protein